VHKPSGGLTGRRDYTFFGWLPTQAASRERKKDITAEFVCFSRLHYSETAASLRGLIVKKETSCGLLAYLIAPIIGIMGLKRKRHFILITEQLYEPESRKTERVRQK
jgi:hypothetical protein